MVVSCKAKKEQSESPKTKRIAKNKTRDELLYVFYTSKRYRNTTS